MFSCLEKKIQKHVNHEIVYLCLFGENITTPKCIKLSVDYHLQFIIIIITAVSLYGGIISERIFRRSEDSYQSLPSLILQQRMRTVARVLKHLNQAIVRFSKRAS